MKRCVLGLVCLAVFVQLCGCGAARQAAADKEMSSLGDETKAALGDKSLDPIRGKVPFFGNSQVTATTAPDSCPNEEEKRAINALRGHLAAFKSKALSLNDKYTFRDMPQMLRTMDAVSFSLIKLYKCELTYQQYAEVHEMIKSRSEQDLVAVQAQIETEKAQRAQAMAAAFGAALQDAGQAMQQREAIRQANKPVRTTCRQVGDHVDCTTY